MKINKIILIFTIMVLMSTFVFSQPLVKTPLLDGVKIVFVSYRTGTADIYMMNSDGSSLEQITNSEENNSFPYQIDERTIGFTRTDSLQNEIRYKVDIYSKLETPLSKDPIRNCAKWEVENPDKVHWAFVRSTDYRDRELFIFNQTTGLETQITSQLQKEYAAYSINHSWSSDGNKLVFMSGPDWFNQFVRIYDLEKGSLTQVTGRGYMNSGLKWLKDNKTLIANLKIWEETTYEIYSIDSSTGELNKLTSGINLHPDISPDGEWIVFESQRHNNDGEVYIMKIDGSNEIRLTRDPNFNGRCIWFKL